MIHDNLTQNSGIVNENNKNLFAQIVGTKYFPRFRYKDMLLTRKQRLWLFLTVKLEIEKKRLCRLDCVKGNAKPNYRVEITE